MKDDEMLYKNKPKYSFLLVKRIETEDKKKMESGGTGRIKHVTNNKELTLKSSRWM